MNIAIIDYGMGNLRSVEKAFAHLGYTAHVTSSPADLEKADKIVLPGVGAFGDGMRELNNRSLVPVIRALVAQHKPFLGICLGMQLLFSESEEAPDVKGLNIIPGRVARFRKGLTVPHMGWNQLHIKRANSLLTSIAEDTYFYFVHSYYVAPEDTDVVIATTDYDVEFASIVGTNNLYATQFHPEKSQHFGLTLLTNFCRL